MKEHQFEQLALLARMRNSKAKLSKPLEGAKRDIF